METNEDIANGITVHPWQDKAWHSKKRFICFCSGVQGGKTFFGSIWVINEVWTSRWSDFIILAPTYKVLQQSTLQKFFEIVPRGYGIHNKSDSTFKTRTGKTIFFRSADKPESIEGITAGAIWADEAGLMKPDAWLFMQRRVSRTEGRILMTFTPKALNWVYYDLYKPWMEATAKKQHTDIEFFQFRSVDSPHFPEEEFERAKQTMTPHQFKLSYEGEFAKAEGLVYPSFGSANIVDDFEVPKDWRRIGGIDFGYINPFCALEGALSPDDELYVYKCHYRSGMTLREHSEYLNPDIVYFYDPSGRQEAEELISMGFELVPANNDVDLGINKVNVRIMGQSLSEDANEGGLQRLEKKRRVRLKVFRSCGDLIEPMGLYQYDKNQTTGEWKDKPMKVNDHSPDALRYLVMGADEYGTPEIIVLG